MCNGECWEHSFSVAAWVTCVSPLSLQTCLTAVHMTSQDHISIRIPCQDLDSSLVREERGCLGSKLQSCTTVSYKGWNRQGICICHMRHSMRRRVSAETWLEGSSWIGSRRRCKLCVWNAGLDVVLAVEACLPIWSLLSWLDAGCAPQEAAGRPQV